MCLSTPESPVVENFEQILDRVMPAPRYGLECKVTPLQVNNEDNRPGITPSH